MWLDGKHGKSLFKYKGFFCITGYEDSKYQIFYTESCNAVFDKSVNKVYEMTEANWTKMMFKMEIFFKY
jgi:hypothetical protein